jgi:hypothetical protein
MKITISQVKTETRDIEIEVPMFFRQGDTSFYAILSDKDLLYTLVLPNYTCVKRAHPNDEKRNIVDENNIAITEGEFWEVYNKSLQSVSSLMPEHIK